MPEVEEESEQRGRTLLTSARALRDSGEACLAQGRAEVLDIRRTPGATVRARAVATAGGGA